MKMTLVNSEHLSDLESMEFAKFNNGQHLCVELPDESCTISVKTPDGEKITFAFCKRHNAEGHQCVDIQHHGNVVNDHGTPIQRGIAFGQGPTVAAWDQNSNPPCTLVAVLL